MYDIKIDKETEFKKLFNVELSSIKNEEILKLWNSYDLTAFAIDDYTQYRKALEYNEDVRFTIRNILQAEAN